jgi:Fe-S-cluster formation regulator IscX/YfhJ
MKRWVLLGGKIHEVDPKEENVRFIDLGNGVVDGKRIRDDRTL